MLCSVFWEHIFRYIRESVIWELELKHIQLLWKIYLYISGELYKIEMKMRKFSLLSKGIFNMQENRKRIIWTLLLATFVFHSILEDVIYPLQYFDEVIALLCFPLAGYHYFVKKEQSE